MRFALGGIANQNLQGSPVCSHVSSDRGLISTKFKEKPKLRVPIGFSYTLGSDNVISCQTERKLIVKSIH